MRNAVWASVIFVAASAHATTLGELLKAASENNVDRQISLEQRKKAALELQQAWTGMLPSVSASANWTNNEYPTEIPAGVFGPSAVVITPENQFDGVLRVELPLIDTSRWFRTAAAAAASDSAEYRDQQNRDGVIRQVTSTYYSYAAALAMRESANRSLAAAEEQEKLQQIRLNAGTVTELEVLRARAEVQRNKQTVSDTEALVATTRRSLRTLTGIDVGEEAALPADNLQPEGALEDLEGRTTELPAVKAAESDARGADRLATAAKLALVPQVTANFTERFANAAGFSGHENSYTAGVGLGWRLDVPTVLNMGTQGSQAQIANLAAERQRLATRDQIHSDWQRLSSAIQKVGAATAQVEAATRAAKVSRDRYAVGATTQLEVIQVERDLFSAEVGQIQARTELATSHVSLRLSAGLPVEVP